MRRGYAALIISFALARPAAATPYETFVDVTDQGDLEDLLASGDITADTFEELLELLGSGVDLDTADRAQLYTLPNLTYDDVDAIIAYRDKNKGVIKDPAALVTAGALSENKLLAVSAFLVVNQSRDVYGVKGWARLMTRWAPDDDIAPPFALRARFTALKHLQAGIAATFTRLDIGKPQYDPSRDALIADQVGNRVVVPKIFVKYEDDEATLIGGTFRAGFAQRLVFDNSSRYTPNGLYSDDELTFSSDLVSKCKESLGELPSTSPPCSEKEAAQHITPDWRWRDGLFGVGAGFKKLEIGSGWLQGYVWASARKRRIYQYELVDRSKLADGTSKCEDPSDDDNPNCAAPPVFVRPDGDPLQSTSKFKFVTLPDVFLERLAGVNVQYFGDRRSSLGVTAYGASEQNLISGIDLDTQEWSSFPTGRRFAAAGANFSFGRGWLDVFGEVAFSYDRIPDTFGPQKGGGGPAAILRVTATKKKEELEAVLRYYGVDYVNPYARPIAQPDTLDGQRARDELGFRLRYYRTDKLYSVRAQFDIWEPPSQTDETKLGRHQPKLDMYARGDFRTTNELRLGLWLRYQDKDLAAGGNGQCFEVSTEFDDVSGEPIPCGGRQLTTIANAMYQQNRTLSFTAKLEHQLLDDPSIVDDCDVMNPGPCKFRQDMSGWLIALWSPQPDVRLRARLRYLDEDISASDSLETSLSALVEAAFKVRKRDVIRVRGDAKWFLDDRAATVGDDNTAPRSPNPEIQLWLSYEARL